VLFEENIANRYLSLCDKLGVTINKSKSIISSRPVVDFVKQTFYFALMYLLGLLRSLLVIITSLED